MISGARTRVFGWLLLLAFSLVAVAGCRTSVNDIQRWENTKSGPRKLVSVLTHAKYPIELRVEAAMSLVRMKPRSGKQVGIMGDEGENKGLVTALAELPPAEREEIIRRLIPLLIEEITRPVPQAQAGQPAPKDPSFPFKDAAFALLTHETALISQEADRRRLKEALAAWCVADFNQRVDESSQMFGVEQVLKHLKEDGVRPLPTLLVPEAKKIPLLAKLVADLGDAPTKIAASERLVAIAREVSSDAWKQKKAPAVQKANEEAGLKKVTADQFQAQLDAYQDEELNRVFGAMKSVGQLPSVEYLLEFAANEKEVSKRRALALAALETNIVSCQPGSCDQRTLGHIDTVLKIARAQDTPDDVRDQAMRRLGEMPRKLIIDKLYELMTHEKWKIRWVTADLILNMSDQSHVDEFMTKLSEAAKKMAIAEPLQYGLRLASLRGKEKPEALADKYADAEYATQIRTTALSYYYHQGTKQDLAKVARYEGDTAEVPSTPDCGGEDAGCKWECEVAKEKESEVKEVATIGDFVKFCVEPAMEKRSGGKQDAPGKNEGKKDEN